MDIYYGYLYGYLLFMDDMTLVRKTYSDMKEMILFVQIICNKWHVVINYQKTKVLICNSKECKQEAIDIGGKSVEMVWKVKYLAEVLNSDLELKDHTEEKRITTQTILNTCLYAASNEVSSKIRMIVPRNLGFLCNVVPTTFLCILGINYALLTL